MVSTKLSATVLAGVLAVSLAACGSNSTSTGASSSSAAATPSAADTGAGRDPCRACPPAPPPSPWTRASSPA